MSHSSPWTAYVKVDDACYGESGAALPTQSVLKSRYALKFTYSR